MGRLKFDGYDIVMQEVPGEISLALNITGCPHHCPGCHSPYMWEDRGEFVADKLPELLERYKGMITCVCFMGGDQDDQDLAHLCDYIKTTDPMIKLAIYIGAPTVRAISESFPFFDYIKIGPYIAERGGLDSTTTNQRMYKKQPDGHWEDITSAFQRSYK